MRHSIVVALALASCSSGGPTETVGFGAAPLMTVTSQSGGLAIDVRSSPQPPARGTNDFELTITGIADGLPRDGLALAVKPWMPAMGHGTSVVPTISPMTNGKYRISGVDLFMAGLWQLRLTLSETTDGGALQDNAAPAFEVP